MIALVIVAGVILGALSGMFERQHVKQTQDYNDQQVKYWLKDTINDIIKEEQIK